MSLSAEGANEISVEDPLLVLCCSPFILCSGVGYLASLKKVCSNEMKVRCKRVDSVSGESQ